jgi:hypothetical protein
MCLNIFRRMSVFYMVMLLSSSLLATAGTSRAATNSVDSPQVTALLNEVKSEASDLKRDSETLESYTRSSLNWQSHASQLTKIKDHINTIGQTIQKLNDARSSASDWQGEATDRILPLAKEIAANAESAIKHLSDNPNRLHDAQYKKYLRSNYEIASDLSGVISDYVDYGEKKGSFGEIAAKLEIER